MRLTASAVVFSGLVAVSGWQALEAGYIHAKARLAQALMQSSWTQTLANGTPVPPWPWADTYPVARLTAQRQRVDLLVLAGASGRSLAFGPGHVDGTALPGEAGNAVISGHRDTHFAFVRDLKAGDVLLTQSRTGAYARYEVMGMEVVHKSDVRVILDAGDSRLTLVTCYPFNTPVPGGPMRYVVVAKRIDESTVQT